MDRPAKDKLEKDFHEMDLIIIVAVCAALLGIMIGFMLGWSVWEDNNVTPIQKPDCEIRKGYYTVINITKEGKYECGITKKFFGPTES